MSITYETNESRSDTRMHRPDTWRHESNINVARCPRFAEECPHIPELNSTCRKADPTFNSFDFEGARKGACDNHVTNSLSLESR